MKNMESKERILTAINRGKPDHIPLHFRTFFGQPPPPFKWKDEFEKTEWFLKKGLDGVLEVVLPMVTPHPDVRIKHWKEERPGEKYPICCKEYDTPAGILRHDICFTGDTKMKDGPISGSEGWTHQREDPPLFNDFNVARAKKHAIGGPEDLPKLRYIFSEPREEQLIPFREYMKKAREFSEKKQVAISGWCAFGTEAAVYLMGVENAIMAAMEEPDFFQELIDHIHKIDVRHFEILIEEGVDILVRRGWYDTTRLWSPALYRRFMVPHFKELVKIAHQANKKVAYTMDCGIMPLLGEFLEIGFDLLYNLDPIQGGTDLKIVKQKLGGHMALQGGVNVAITLYNNNEVEIRKAVREAIEILAPGSGFILSGSDALEPDVPWSAINTVIETWKQWGEW